MGIKREQKLMGQVSIEFALSFTVALLFLALVTRIFIWFCGNVVARQAAFENSRNSVHADSLWTTPGSKTYPGSDGTYSLPPVLDFYNQSTDGNKLKIF